MTPATLAGFGRLASSCRPLAACPALLSARALLPAILHFWSLIHAVCGICPDRKCKIAGGLGVRLGVRVG